MSVNENIPTFYLKKVIEEKNFLHSSDGPLSNIILNQPVSETNLYGVTNDFSDEKTFLVSDEILHKYNDRILVLLTKKCLGNCKYCFRQKDIKANNKEYSPEEIIRHAINYVNLNKEVSEIILSGGDPISIGEEKIEGILKAISDNTNITNIRIHTKAIVYNPNLFTSRLIDILSTYNVRIVFHITHPYEICDQVKNTIYAMISKGIRCYNQFPLLRNINDNSAVIIKLLRLLDELNVKNLSIFIPDPLSYLNGYRLCMNRIIQIANEVNNSTPAWINSTRFVLDSKIGKVRLENIVKIDNKKNVVIFEKDGKQLIYPDLPQKYDIPGNLNKLLWKED